MALGNKALAGLWGLGVLMGVAWTCPARAQSALVEKLPIYNYQGWLNIGSKDSDFAIKVPDSWTPTTPHNEHEVFSAQNWTLKDSNQPGLGVCSMLKTADQATVGLTPMSMHYALELNPGIVQHYVEQQSRRGNGIKVSGRIVELRDQAIVLVEATEPVGGHAHPTVIKAYIAIINVPGWDYVLNCRTGGRTEVEANAAWSARHDDFVRIIASISEADNSAEPAPSKPAPAPSAPPAAPVVPAAPVISAPPAPAPVPAPPSTAGTDAKPRTAPLADLSYKDWQTVHPAGAPYTLQLPPLWTVAASSDPLEVMSANSGERGGDMDRFARAVCSLHAVPHPKTAQRSRAGMNDVMEHNPDLVDFYAHREEGLHKGTKATQSSVEHIGGQPVVMLETVSHVPGKVAGSEATSHALVAIMDVPGTQYTLSCTTGGLDRQEAGVVWDYRQEQIRHIVQSLHVDD